MTKDEMIDFLEEVMTSKIKSYDTGQHHPLHTTENRLKAADILSSIQGWKVQHCMRKDKSRIRADKR